MANRQTDRQTDKRTKGTSREVYEYLIDRRKDHTFPIPWQRAHYISDKTDRKKNGVNDYSTDKRKKDLTSSSYNHDLHDQGWFTINIGRH